MRHRTFVQDTLVALAVVGALLGAAPRARATVETGPNNVIAPAAPATCITAAHPCVTVPVNIARTDAIGVRGFSVTLQLSANLALCTGSTSDVSEGSYLNSVGSTSYQVLSNGGGSYTVDCAILGATAGATAASGNLFNLSLKNVGADGTGTVTVTSVILRDPNNASILTDPGAPASVTIDHVAPATIADLAASQVKTANDADGTTKIKLTFTAPGDAATVEVYRAGYGNYPEYDDGGTPGSVPSAPSYPPGAPWVLTGVTATNQNDETTARDFYYYAVFTKDACGNVSSVSNETGGTLNYHLGDVANGITDCQGDNHVSTADISLLGAHYGITLGEPATYGCLDVGPTTDNSVNGRPTTDNKVNFEDLILFAINDGVVSAPQMAAHQAPSDRDQMTVSAPSAVTAGQSFMATLRLQGAGDIQGLSAQLNWDASVVRPVSVDAGDWMLAQNGVVLSAGPGNVDAALLGVRDMGVAGDGVLATVRFEALRSGAPAIGVARVTARDAANRPVAFGTATGLPHETALMPVAPNPFRNAASLSFALPREAAVDLAVFSLDGRRVRTLAHETRAAGVHSVSWNGTDDRGNRVHPGVYYVRLATPTANFQKSVVMLR